MGQAQSTVVPLVSQSAGWIMGAGATIISGGSDAGASLDAELRPRCGPMRGKRFTFEDGRRVRAYLGVPFASCGAFDGRFQKPQPVEPWTETRDCTRFGPRSIQTDMFWDYFLTPVPQDESNCLHMNIFIPEVEDAHNLPVVVFTHGGGYIIHSSANYGDREICRNLCRHGVIVCMIQYRLGLLGFLSTGTPECPGNFGLWDQRQALMWIRDNIRDFGGDPDNVTIMGQSAGASSADLLSLSPHCRGLFKRVVLMGGTASADWATVEPQRTMRAAVAIARKHGWMGNPNDGAALVRFFRSLPADKCKAAIFGKSAFNRSRKGLDFCPVIDGDFLPAPIAELRRTAPPISAIVGTTDFEALLFVALGRAQYDLVSLEKQLRIHIPDLIPAADELRDEARRLYLPAEFADADARPPRSVVARSFLRLYSDTLMNNATQRYAEEMTAAGHSVYLYNFTHFNPAAFGVLGIRMPFHAATHCHDIRYLFGKGMYAKFRPNADDLRVLDFITRSFCHFAKTGNPNYADNRWLPLQSSNPYMHMDIAVEPRFMDNYQERRAEFWKKIEALKESLKDSRDYPLD